MGLSFTFLSAMTKVVNRFTIMFGALTEDTIDST